MSRKIIDSNGLLYYHQKMITLLGNKVDKVAGKDLISTSEITRLAKVSNYNDATVKESIETLKSAVEALQAGTYDDTAIRQLITECNTAITNLSNAVIKGVKRNGATVTPSGGVVNITVPTKVSDVTNDAGYQTAAQVTNAISTAVASAVRYKGTVVAWANLPTGASVGDMYNIQNKSANNNAGDNVVWNGTAWDIQAGTVDLSNYLSVNDIITNAEIDALLA